LILWQAVEADGAIIIFAVVGPGMRSSVARLRETLSVEVSEEVLLARSSLRSTGTETDLQGPDASLSSVRRNAEEVRALPITGRISGRSEVAEVCPVLQIGRVVKPNLVFLRQGDGHEVRSEIIRADELVISARGRPCHKPIFACRSGLNE
jgi:glycine/D-amino acid oxidase-like deaminating enzyme